MIRRTRSFFIVTLCGFFLTLIFFSCSRKDDGKEKQYASLSDSTGYVGIQACRQCHADKYETFMETGMGLSFDKASVKKSSAKFSPDEIINDKFHNLNYHPFWKNDSLFVSEFRLSSRDTVFKRNEKVEWIVGSGQHTNSHMMNVNGYVYQVPATFYTQKGQWDLPPGFENGFNSRFSRMIELECMTCHNAYPKIVMGSENKYDFVANGIDCERCHGPGSKHVSEMLAGKLTDVKKEVDYSIVNPAKLPVALQLDICQRCHIQGNAVLKEGKSFLDFRPGMSLSQVMDFYMPLYKNDDSHIMASHVERLKMSKCFIVSTAKTEGENKNHPSLEPYKNSMTCVTCHNPHISVKETDQSVFNDACKSCHHGIHDSVIVKRDSRAETTCTQSMTERMKVNDNCVTCHMPKNGTIDIPHVTTTDHWIRKPSEKNDVKKIKEFAGLVCINNPQADCKSKGIAFLSYFEKFSSNPAYLDSAKKYLNDSNRDSIEANFKCLVRWAFLKNDFKKVIAYVRSHSNALASLNKMSYSNDDAWTAYRIGESFLSEAGVEDALKYFQKAVDLEPFSLDFRNKLAGTQMDVQSFDEARRNYEFILKQNPKYASAYVSYGYLLLLADHNVIKADEMYDKALQLDPDNMQAFFNKAGTMIYRGRNTDAVKYLKEVLKREPSNMKAKLLLQQLQKVS